MEEGKLVVDSECKMTEIKSDECINNDFPKLSDEKFDFDLSLSPSSENEDEVFVGPVGHKEKCIAASIETCEGSIPPVPSDNLMWSPFAGEKFAEIVKEAHLVALQIQSGSKPKRPHAHQLGDQRLESVEKFVQESKSKLKILETSIKMERTPREAVRRETYCVWESPVAQRPPSFQKHSRQPVQVKDNMHSPLIPQEVSSPRTGKLPKSFITQVAQGCGDKDDKKSSKLQTVKALCVFGNNSLVVEQPEQESPYHPSRRKHLKSMGSLEDLLSSKSSIVPDAKNSSLMQDKRRLPTPSKLSMKTTQLKPPNDAQMRKNALSSSSSSSSLSSMNSSLNSSLFISPKRGKVKTNIVAKATCGFGVSSGTTKIAMVRPMRVSSVQASHSDMSGKQERSTCATTKGNPSVNVAKSKAAFESKSSGSGIRRMSLDPRLQKSSQKSLMKERRVSSCSENKMAPSTKEGMSSEKGVVRILQPIAFLSGGNVGSDVAVSPPVKQLEEQTVLNSCSSIKSIWTPASIKHSGLPTSVGRCMSGLPARIAKTLPRSTSSPNLPVRRVSSMLSKTPSEASSERAKENNVQAAHSSSTSSSEGDLFPQAVSVALNFSPEKSPSCKQDLVENQKPAEETQAKEGLLIDLGIDTPPVAHQECENKPLIDFFNTPEMIKALPLKPTEQLLDLGSPLIYLSPEGNKENLDSPLLKF